MKFFGAVAWKSILGLILMGNWGRPKDIKFTIGRGIEDVARIALVADGVCLVFEEGNIAWLRVLVLAEASVNQVFLRSDSNDIPLILVILLQIAAAKVKRVALQTSIEERTTE